MFKQFGDMICCRDDLSSGQKGKPAPDIYRLVQTKFNVLDSKNFLVFEDSINGVTAALKAGMNVSVFCLINYLAHLSFIILLLLLFAGYLGPRQKI